MLDLDVHLKQGAVEHDHCGTILDLSCSHGSFAVFEWGTWKALFGHPRASCFVASRAKIFDESGFRMLFNSPKGMVGRRTMPPVLFHKRVQ